MLPKRLRSLHQGAAASPRCAHNVLVHTRQYFTLSLCSDKQIIRLSQLIRHLCPRPPREPDEHLARESLTCTQTRVHTLQTQAESGHSTVLLQPHRITCRFIVATLAAVTWFFGLLVTCFSVFISFIRFLLLFLCFNE